MCRFWQISIWVYVHKLKKLAPRNWLLISHQNHRIIKITDIFIKLGKLVLKSNAKNSCIWIKKMAVYPLSATIRQRPPSKTKTRGPCMTFILTLWRKELCANKRALLNFTTKSVLVYVRLERYCTFFKGVYRVLSLLFQQFYLCTYWQGYLPCRKAPNP